MARRAKRTDPESIRLELIQLLTDFKSKLQEDNLREQVLALVPANHRFRDLGSSLLKGDNIESARDRILAYLRKYPMSLISGTELMVVAGISEYPRRIRELRVEYGWPIFSGKSLKSMFQDGDRLESVSESDLKPDVYLLVEDMQDKEAAYRWNLANDIRKSNASVKDKLLAYFRKNVGKHITGEELQYLAKDKSEWARRVRELRTEDGWSVLTKASGLPDLPVGVYVLESDVQAEVHDRKIPDLVRVEVLERDKFCCRLCNWTYEQRRPVDKRSMLELHHIQHHKVGGANTVGNLITLCNICHDEVHRGNVSESNLFSLIRSVTE